MKQSGFISVLEGEVRPWLFPSLEEPQNPLFLIRIPLERRKFCWWVRIWERGFVIQEGSWGNSAGFGIGIGFADLEGVSTKCLVTPSLHPEGKTFWKVLWGTKREIIPDFGPKSFRGWKFSQARGSSPLNALGLISFPAL